MRREFVEPARHTTRSPAAPQHRAQPAAGAGHWLALQRAAGNRAVGQAVHLQRCGGEVHAGCACAGPEAGPPVEEVQRDAALGGGTQVQRDDPPADPPKDPADLTGTPFASFDPTLKQKLADKSIFAWSKPTLAESLGELSNASVAVIARVGSLISQAAPFLWPYVASLGNGGWITDNFGMRVGWTDSAAVEAVLVGKPDFCKDNPATAKYYHGTTSAYRQIPATKGAPSMHVVTAGGTEVHIDAHQPVEGKSDSFLWPGSCEYDWGAWLGHADDVAGGGAGGARGTAVGRYSMARGAINTARGSVYFEKDSDEPQLAEAAQNLDLIAKTVTKYAAMGKLEGSEWEGDRVMQQDADCMAKLQRAEALIRQVDIAQDGRKPEMTPMQ
jgi:hypothetical protein